MAVRYDSQDVKAGGSYYCWLSGMARPDDYAGPWYLQIAHIASGAGKARRVDDRRAVVVLCPIAHDCHVSNSDAFPCKTINGITYPTIDERHTLYLKQVFDPAFYDEEFLSKIWIGRLPEPQRPPDAWCAMMLNNRGIIL